MPSTQNRFRESSRPWQDKAWVHLFATALGVLPLYAGLVILQLRRGQQISTQAFTFYLAVIAPIAIGVIWLLLRFLCGEALRDLNLRPGKLSVDLLAALILSIVILATNVIVSYFLSRWIPKSGTNTSVTDLFVELASRPGRLALFAGPLLFLGAASEELVRVFFLSRLWKVWPSPASKLLVALISAGLFGLIHLYPRPASAAGKAILGFIMAICYLRFGRVVPLILAHYLTNALQLVIFAVR